MRSDMSHRRMAGFGLVEVMIAMALGLIVTAGVTVIFIAQRQVYNTSSSQSQMQDADNAISAVITPIARGIGFLGCGALNSGSGTNISGASSSLIFNTSNGAVQGYTGTLPTSLVDNAANDSAASDWSPSLDSSIGTAAEQGSDVLVLIGAVPNAKPIGLPNGISGSPFTVNDATQLSAISAAGPLVVGVSDCNYSAVFLISTLSGTALSYASLPLSIGMQANSQLIPLQQTMFYIGQGQGGQSGLFEGVMTMTPGAGLSSAKWTYSEIVPGVLAMKVLYGIGSTTASANNNEAIEYLDASKITNWMAVTTVKIGFLVEGGLGSATIPSGPEKYTIFNDTVTVPADSRMRHVFYMTINTRNATL